VLRDECCVGKGPLFENKVPTLFWNRVGTEVGSGGTGVAALGGR
jgi:hypothetical protein